MNLTHEQKGFTFDKVSQDAYEEWNNKLSRIQVEGGRLPKWELSGMETDVMVGDPAVIVIADTYIRGIRDFDVALAYEAMKENATTLIPLTQPGYNEHIQKGYIPELRENEQREDPWVWGSVSTGLEYCMADFAMSQMALALNKESAGENADEKNFIDEIRINGKMSKKYFITNDQITNGGILTFSFK